MMATAYDYVVGTSTQVAAATVGRAPAQFAGCTGPDGPAIEQWPRSPRTGQPMTHCFTSWLPEDYRRQGPELVAVSVFQWFDMRSHEFPFVPYGPSGARILGHLDANAFYAVRWLTEGELTGQRTTRPTSTQPLDPDESEETNGASTYGPRGELWLVPRADPNAGLAPVDMPEPDEAYVDVPDRAQRFSSQHLGGTFMNPNGPDHDLSPWYLEVSRLGGFDFAGGDLPALDLDAAYPLGRPLKVDVPFHQLAEWESTRTSDGSSTYTRAVFVWIAFAHRLIATGEADGASWHAGTFPPDEALTTFSYLFQDKESAWLRPYVERLAAGEDWRPIQADAAAEYARRNAGSSAPTRVWPLER